MTPLEQTISHGAIVALVRPEIHGTETDKNTESTVQKHGM
jgi:hypothetical protein